MAALGNRRPIIIEQWAQAKNSTGSLVPQLVDRSSCYAEIKRTGGARGYERYQTVMPDVYRMRVRKILDVNGLYKVIYKGRRLTVLSVEQESEKRFYYTLIVETK